MDLQRRRWLRRGAAHTGLALAGPLLASTARAHGAEGEPGPAAAVATPAAPADLPTGWVRPPQVAPALPLRVGDGRSTTLAQRLKGQITAVQLIYTGCNGSCPAQGAAFAALAERLPASQPLQLLSLSVDALGDTPDSLRAWQQRFDPRPAACWQVGVSPPAEVERLHRYLRGLPAGSPAPGVGEHTDQVFVFDRQARLVWRSGSAPPLRLVMALMGQLLQTPA